MSRILIVDDDAQIRSVMGRVLSREDHEVILAGDGEAALTILRNEPVDLVVTDLYMPGVDGIELVIRLLGDGRGVPIVAVSGGGYMAKEAVLERAEGLGVRGTLAKPFTPWELIDAVRSVLGPGEEESAEAEAGSGVLGRGAGEDPPGCGAGGGGVR